MNKKSDKKLDKSKYTSREEVPKRVINFPSSSNIIPYPIPIPTNTIIQQPPVPMIQQQKQKNILETILAIKLLDSMKLNKNLNSSNIIENEITPFTGGLTPMKMAELEK